MFHYLLLLAEDPKPQPGGGGLFTYLPLLLGFIVLYFIFMRPGRGDAERKALLSSLKKNDKVITIAGIYGTVVNVAEKEDEVTVRIDDNVKFKMLKSAIARNLTNEEAFKAAQAEKASAKKAGATAAAPAAPAADATAVTKDPTTPPAKA